MLKRFLVITSVAALSVVCFSNTAHAALSSNGGGLFGQGNGTGLNGFQLNGIRLNGSGLFGPNGISLNGGGLFGGGNGNGLNGCQLNGNGWGVSNGFRLNGTKLNNNGNSLTSQKTGLTLSSDKFTSIRVEGGRLVGVQK
jgi:hypothetical protein